MNSYAVVPTMPLYAATNVKFSLVFLFSLMTYVTWFEVEQPYIKLFSLAKLSSPSCRRKGCRKAMLVFSVPLSALKIVGALKCMV